MELGYEKVYLSSANHHINKRLYASSGDYNSRGIHIILNNHGEATDVSNYQLFLYYKKKSGELGNVSGRYLRENIFEATYPTSMLNEIGEVECNLKIVDGEKTLHTINFIVEVTDSFNEAPEGSNEPSELQALGSKLKELKDRVDEIGGDSVEFEKIKSQIVTINSELDALETDLNDKIANINVDGLDEFKAETSAEIEMIKAQLPKIIEVINRIKSSLNEKIESLNEVKEDKTAVVKKLEALKTELTQLITDTVTPFNNLLNTLETKATANTDDIALIKQKADKLVVDGDGKSYLANDGTYKQIEAIGGEKGADGKSAYEVAQDNGFTGSESEWLASLKGQDGKDGRQGERGLKGEQGIAGLKGDAGPQGEKGDIGPQGPKGDDGKSAYEIAIENNQVPTFWNGSSVEFMSESKWIESLNKGVADFGENENGKYWKYSNGLLICEKVFKVEGGDSWVDWGGWKASKLIGDWIFPERFASEPTIIGNNQHWSITIFGDIDNTKITKIYFYRVTAPSYTSVHKITAIGRWK